MEKQASVQVAGEKELARCSEALIQAGKLHRDSLWSSYPTKAQWTKGHADELRIAGNESYKAGALHDAIRFYENAINVANEIQEDSLLPTYLSNLSAAYYESGDYEKALDIIDRAFDYLQVEHDRQENSSPLDIKLRVRECRCLLHIQEFDQLLDAVQEIDQIVYDEHMEFGVVEDAALHSLDQLATWDSERARKLIPSLPRYRPSMKTGPGSRYRTSLGYSAATSALKAYDDMKEDEKARIPLANSTYLAFFYGGCRDLRDVLATVIDVGQQKPPSSSTLDIRFALVNKNPSIVARNILILFILDDLASKDLEKRGRDVTEILTVLHYTYLGAIMPNWVHERLLGYIRVVSTKLCSGLGVPSWIGISLQSIDHIIPVFKYWIREAADSICIQDWMNIQKPIDGPANVLSLANMSPEQENKVKESREQARADIKDAIYNFSDAQLNTILSNKCHNPQKLAMKAKKELAYKVFATDEALDTLNRKRYVPDGLLMEYSTFYQGSLKMLYGPETLHDKEPKLAEHLKTLWSLWGAANKAQLEDSTADLKDRSASLLTVKQYVQAHWRVNVTLLEEHWQLDTSKPLSEEMSFDAFAVSQQLVSNTGIRPLVKPSRTYDYTATFFWNAAQSVKTYGPKFLFEWMVDDVHHTLETINKSPEESNFDFFDRLYFNIDSQSSGGLLPQIVDSIPILKPSTYGFLSSKVIEAKKAHSMTSIFPEHLCLADADEAQQYLGFGIQGHDLRQADCVRFRPLSPANVTNILSAGRDWKGGSSVQRHQLIDWLHQIFLKIVVPLKHNNQASKKPSRHPLNLHSFFRLLLYLQSIDFPAHWLSSVIDDIIQNRVSTRSRPPTNSTQASSSPEKLAAKPICMTPFQLEMEVALTIWFPLLTFGITATEFPDASRIRNYTIKLNILSESMTLRDESLPLLALWFSTNSAKKISLDLAREIVGSHNALQSVRILSSFEWDYATKMATFMCNTSSMELLQIQNFTLRLIRTDTYETVSVVAPVKHCVALSSLSEWQEPV